MSMTRLARISAVTSPSAPGVMMNVKFWLAEELTRFEAVPPVTDTSDMANVAGSIGLPKSTVTVTDVALVGEAASVDRAGPGVVLSKVICRALDAVLPLPAGSVTLLAGIVTVMVPSEAGVTVNVYCWVVAPFWARLEAVPPETDTSDMANVAGFIGSPKSTVTVANAALVGEAASVDRAGPGGALSKVTLSTLEAVLPLSAMSMTRLARISAVTSPSAPGVIMNVKVWLAEELTRFEAVPPVTDTSDMANVAGSIGLPKSTVTVTDVALVGEAASVDRAGPGVVLSKVICRALDAVLPLPAGSVTLSAGIVTVMVPSEAGVTVNVYCWVVAPSWARLEAVPPETDTSDMANVAGSIGSPKSTVTVANAALVGEAASVDRAGPGGALSKVTLSTLDAVLPLSAMSMTRLARISAVTSPSALGVIMNVKVWLAEELTRFEAVPPVTDTSDMANVAGSIGLPKSTVTVTDVALVGEAASVDRAGPGVVLSKVICRALDAVLPLPAGSVTLSAGIVTVMVPSEAGVTVNVYCWVVAPSWARLEAVPPETDTSDMANVAGSIGSPKSTVTVANAALVGEAASVDRAGPGGALSKVTLSTLDAVLPLSAMSMTRLARISAVTSPSALGVIMNVKVWLAEELTRFEAVPPVTDTSDMANVAGSIGLPKSTVTVTDVALVGEAASVDRAGPGVVLSKVICRALDAVLPLPAGSVTLSAGIVTVMVPSEAGVTVNVYCWVVAPSWARLEAVPPETDTSDMANVAGSIGSPKSTVTVANAALVGEAASVDRAGPGGALSKVTLSTLDAVLPLSAMSMTRLARISAVTSPSAPGVMMNVKFWLAEELTRFEAVPPVTDTSDMANVAGSIGLPKSTVTVTDVALVGEAASVDRAGPGVSYRQGGTGGSRCRRLSAGHWMRCCWVVAGRVRDAAGGGSPS